MEILTRQEAKELGHKFYYDGIPCTKCGNLGKRYVSSHVRLCLDCHTQNTKKRKQGLTREDNRRVHFKHAYGISIEEYEELKKKQNHRCAICGGEEHRIVWGQKSNLCVDHCHITGRVRGLLCSRCNSGIGFLDDSIEKVEAAVSYLRKATSN